MSCGASIPVEAVAKTTALLPRFLFMLVWMGALIGFASKSGSPVPA